VVTEKLPQGYCAHRPKTSEALISRKTLEPTMSSDTVGNTYYLFVLEAYPFTGKEIYSYSIV
jgi:hypothetical protein